MKYVLTLLLCFGLAAPCGAGVVLQLDSAPGYQPGETSDAFQLSVQDPDPLSEDRLIGWQLRLQVVAQAGATGTVTFADPEIPASGYLLDGVNFGLNSVFGTNVVARDELLVFDFDSRAGTDGVIVPGAPGARLVDIRLEASADASGVFALQAVGGTGNSEYTGPGLLPLEFENLPSGGNFVLANVTAIPEPSQITWLLLLGAVTLRKNRRR